LEKRNFYNEKDVGKTFLWAIILPQLLAFVVAYIFAGIYQDPKALENSLSYIIVMTLLAQIGFFIVYFFINKKSKINFLVASKIKTKFSVRNMFVCILISLIAVLGFVNFIGLIDGVFQKFGFISSGIQLPMDNFGWYMLNVLLLAIIPAIFEELIFRGIIFNGLRKRGFWFAALISSLMFAIMHLSINQFVFPLIMGIIFTLIVEKTGSVVYSMITHFCNNFIILTVEYIAKSTGFNLFGESISGVMSIILFVLLAATTFVTIFVIIKKLMINKSKTQDNQQAEKGKKEHNLWLYISLGVGALIWLVTIVATYFTNIAK